MSIEYQMSNVKNLLLNQNLNINIGHLIFVIHLKFDI